jgi:hypothetical protein
LENDDWDNLKQRILEIVGFELWDDNTKASLSTYLTLRGAKYLFPVNLKSNSLTIAIMIDDEIRTITIGNP